jgi:hypothetical protein
MIALIVNIVLLIQKLYIIIGRKAQSKKNEFQYSLSKGTVCIKNVLPPSGW